MSDLAPARTSGTGPRGAVLFPTVLVSFGPTGARTLALAAERLRESLGGLPPFFAFLALEQVGDELRSELRLGEELVPTDDAVAGGEEGVRAATALLRAASARVTAYGNNRENATFRGLRNAFERVEYVAIAALDEVEQPELLLRPLQQMAREFDHCWRVGFLWSEPLERLTTEEAPARRARLAERLAHLDEVQGATEGMVRRPAFEACFLLGRPSTQGVRTLDPEDAARLAASILCLYADSSLGAPFRRALAPNPGPTRFHLGLDERGFEASEIVRALRARLWREVHDFLVLGDASESGAGVGPFASAAPGTLEEEGVELTEESVDRTLARLERAVMDEAVDSAGTSAGEGDAQEPGALARAERVLRTRLEELRRVRYQWQREKDVAYRRFRSWELAREPLREWTVSDTVVDVERRWGAALLALVPAFFVGAGALLDLKLPSTGPLGLAAASLALAATIAFVFPRRSERARVTGTRTNPEYEKHRARGEALARRVAVTRYLAGARTLGPIQLDPSQADGGPRDESMRAGSQPETGLLRLEHVLAERHLHAERLRRALGARAEESEARGDASATTFGARGVLALFERGVNRRSASRTGGGDGGSTRETLRAALGRSWQTELFEQGPEPLLSRVERLAEDLFARHRGLGLLRAAALVDEARGTPGETCAEFFESLSRGAALLGEPGPDEIVSETRFLLHGERWDERFLAEGARLLGGCEVVPIATPGRLVLLRLTRGPSWAVGRSMTS